MHAHSYSLMHTQTTLWFQIYMLCTRVPISLLVVLISDTLHVFDGQPPLWVYPEMAKPLTLLLKNNGYKEMVSIS